MNTAENKQVFIVEASAGSGKTYELAKRYLRLLINADKQDTSPMRRILAITFTNKAMIEMKERIREFLKNIAFDSFPGKKEKEDIINYLGVEESAARAKAFACMDEIIKHYDYFSVQTIDSFINAVLLGCSSRIERTASFKIKRDYADYLSFALDKTIDAAADDKDIYRLFEDFLQHYLFVENREGWFPREDIMDLMRSFFKMANKYGGVFGVYKGTGKAVLKQKIAVRDAIDKLYNNLPEGLNARVKKTLDAFLGRNPEAADIQSIPEVLGKAHPPMNKDATAAPSFDKQWQACRKKIKELVEIDATVAYNPYSKLFECFMVSFQSFSKDDDVLFLEELNRKARFVFGDDGVTVAELYYCLAGRFRHYLVDEFQDTSLLQWRNLEVLVKEALASGGTFFYVGDKKQAIYRFRGGEAGLFEGLKEELKQYGREEKKLAENFRSHKAIVEFNNEVFSRDNLKRMIKDSGIAEELCEDETKINDILSIFSDSRQSHREENKYGFVSVEKIDAENKLERDAAGREKLMNLLLRLRGRFSNSDIVILARDNNEVELITGWLLEEKIAVESEKTLNIKENPQVREIISLLNFLYSPIDDLNFAAFIMGEVFRGESGIPLREAADFLFKLNKKETRGGSLSLYHSFRRHYPQAWEKHIEDFFKTAGLVSVYELACGIYQRFRVLERFPSYHGFFMKFLELIKEKEEECPGLGDFLSYLKGAPSEDLYLNVPSCDSIRVLTVHKSKGLEFNVVVIPFLRMEINPETGGKGTSSYLDESYAPQLGLLRITKKHRFFSSTLEAVYSHAYKNACIDELNNVYVALTRAKYELYVFVPKKSGNANNKAYHLIPGITKKGQEMDYSACAGRKPENSPGSLTVLAPRECCDWSGFMREESRDEGQIKNFSAIARGDIIHAILSRVGVVTEGGASQAINLAIEYAAAVFSGHENWKEYAADARRLVDSPVIKDFFYVPGADVYCEKEIVNYAGNTKRIDRLVVTDKEAVVIDYKTSRSREEDYKKQVAEYKDIVSAMYPGKKIKGYIVYIEEAAVLEVD